MSEEAAIKEGLETKEVVPKVEQEEATEALTNSSVATEEKSDAEKKDIPEVTITETEPEEPEVKDEVPEVKDEVPEVKDEVPEVKDEVPEVKDEVPEVKDEVPEVKDEVPEVKDKVPEVKEEVTVEHMEEKVTEVKEGKTLEIKEEIPEAKADAPPEKEVSILKEDVPEIKIDDPEIEEENTSKESNETPEIKENEDESTDHPPEVTKAAIRQRIWEYMESNDLVNFPRPVHHRIPNFKDANIAGDTAANLDVFKKANTIKINPDKPQEQCRFHTLESIKTLLVPTPRLRTGLFNKITPPPNFTKEDLRICSMSQGVREYSRPIGLEDKVKVDLVILGSVAVSREGHRIGKGEGFADLEFAMMATMGAVDEDTIVVTTVHDCQVTEIPEHLMGAHDVSVDYIVTPTEVIRCPKRSKPSGVIWSMLTTEKFRQVPILKKLRAKEAEAGTDVTLKVEPQGQSQVRKKKKVPTATLR